MIICSFIDFSWITYIKAFSVNYITAGSLCHVSDCLNRECIVQSVAATDFRCLLCDKTFYEYYSHVSFQTIFK
jgi:hypothetical protein